MERNSQAAQQTTRLLSFAAEYLLLVFWAVGLKTNMTLRYSLSMYVFSTNQGRTNLHKVQGKVEVRRTKM